MECCELFHNWLSTCRVTACSSRTDRQPLKGWGCHHF